MPSLSKLIAVFEEARRLLSLPDNDYSWSSWLGSEDGLDEIDSILTALRAGTIPRPHMQIIFLATGPLQEVSLSSGWGNDFIALANRFDDAMASPPDDTP